jgi:hypothetical protein
VTTPSAARLEHAVAGVTQSPAQEHSYTQLPRPYPKVAALARSVTAGATNTYDKVQMLISWMGAHTRYSTAIPPLRPGEDTVDEFLFGNRTGFCEQISTSLAVLLRSLDIPVREVVGYVPGPYNPITDLYEVRAEDAHAWVQVWFPGYGWQSFDPTAVVPLANPSPGATALRDAAHFLAQLPWVPMSAAAGVVGSCAAVIRWRRRRPVTWEQRVVRRMERTGRKAGRQRRGSETICEYARALDKLASARRPGRRHHAAPRRGGPEALEWSDLAEIVQASAYGGREPSEESKRRVLACARRMRVGGSASRRSGATSSSLEPHRGEPSHGRTAR